MRLMAAVLVTTMTAIATSGCADTASDARGENYCDENPYARDCPLEDKAGRTDEDALREAVEEIEKNGLPDDASDGGPADDRNTLPDESNGPTGCDVDYDPGYCGDYRGP